MEALFLFAEADVSSLCNVRLALEQHSAAFVRRAAAAWVARLPSLPPSACLSLAVVAKSAPRRRWCVAAIIRRLFALRYFLFVILSTCITFSVVGQGN